MEAFLKRTATACRQNLALLIGSWEVCFLTVVLSKNAPTIRVPVLGG